MTLVTEVLIGIYLGLLAGIIPALIAGILGFVFKYVTNVSIPALAVVVLAAAIAGVNGGLMGLLDEQVASSPKFGVALMVVMMLALYAHFQGDKLGAALPKKLSLRSLRERTLSADAIHFVGAIGQVEITPVAITDMEGYPALSPELRAELQAGSWTFPADLPLSELESRLCDRLRMEYDLADVVASIDGEGRATIAAAPPMSGLSRRVPDDHRAVSIGALVPTGIARGEQVDVHLPDRTIAGTVVSAKSDPKGTAPEPSTPDVATDGGRSRGAGSGSASTSDPLPDGGEEEPAAIAAPTTTGGWGRVTVAVPRQQASHLLGVDRARVVVKSRGTRREFELVALLRRAGKRFAKLSVREHSAVDGTTLGGLAVRDSYGVVVMAIKHSPAERAESTGTRRWEFAPRGSTSLSAGDELFVVGRTDAVDSFRAAMTGAGEPPSGGSA